MSQDQATREEYRIDRLRRKCGYGAGRGEGMPLRVSHLVTACHAGEDGIAWLWCEWRHWREGSHDGRIIDWGCESGPRRLWRAIDESCGGTALDLVGLGAGLDAMDGCRAGSVWRMVPVTGWNAPIFETAASGGQTVKVGLDVARSAVNGGMSLGTIRVPENADDELWAQLSGEELRHYTVARSGRRIGFQWVPVRDNTTAFHLLAFSHALSRMAASQAAGCQS